MRGTARIDVNRCGALVTLQPPEQDSAGGRLGQGSGAIDGNDATAPQEFPGNIGPLEASLSMMTIPVSVNLIVKNCASSLDACLASLDRFVVDPRDEIVVVDTGSTDGGATVMTAQKYGAKVIERPDLRKDLREKVRRWLPEWEYVFDGEPQCDGGMIMDFGEAREIALEASRNDCVFWLDSDDTLWEQRPGGLRMAVEQGFGKQFDALFLEYEYRFDEHDGRCTQNLKRERIVDRRIYRWKGRCHETLVPVAEGQSVRAAFYHDLPLSIRHTSHRRQDHYADARNYLILRSELEEDLATGRLPDVRTRYYLGNACRGLGLIEEGLRHYRDTVDRSDSPGNRYAAQLYIAEMYLTLPDVRPREAVAAGQACIRLSPGDPRGHFIVSRACAIMRRWDEALQWFEAGRALSMPETTHALDREQVLSFPLVVAVKCAIALGRLDHAHRLAEELRQRRPDHPDTLAVCAELNDAFVREAMQRV